MLHIWEGRKEVLKQHFVESGKVPEEVFDNYVEKDPSPNYKYLQWMLFQYTKFPDKENHIPDVVKLFASAADRGKLKGREANIEQYDLDSAEEIALQKAQQKTASQKKKEEKSDARKVKETDRYLVVSPQSHKASCFYGAHTKWCISAKTADYWDEYYRAGVEFYIIVDKQENKKYAVAVLSSGEKEVYDEHDRKMSYEVLKKRLGIGTK